MDNDSRAVASAAAAQSAEAAYNGNIAHLSQK